MTAEMRRQAGPLTPQAMKAAGFVGAHQGAPIVWSHREDIEDWERPILEALGTRLRDARLAIGIGFSELYLVAGTERSLKLIEAGAKRVRWSRLHPWLELLGLATEPFLAEYIEVLAPESRWHPYRPPRESVPARPRASRRKPQPLPQYVTKSSSPAGQALGAELWAMRVALDMPRPVLARRIHCSPLHVWEVEQGRYRPSRGLLERWVVACLRPVLEAFRLELKHPDAVAPRAAQPMRQLASSKGDQVP